MKGPAIDPTPRTRAPRVQAKDVQVLDEPKSVHGESKELLSCIDDTISRLFNGIYGLANDINDVTNHNINELVDGEAAEPTMRTNTCIGNRLEIIQLRLNSFEAQLNNVRGYVNI